MQWGSTGIILLAIGWVLMHIIACLGAIGFLVHGENHLGNRIVAALAIVTVILMVDGGLFLLVDAVQPYRR